MVYLPAHSDRITHLEFLSTWSGFIYTQSGIGRHLTKKLKPCSDVCVLRLWPWHCWMQGNVPDCLQAGSSHENSLASSAIISQEKGKGSQTTEKKKFPYFCVCPAATDNSVIHCLSLPLFINNLMFKEKKLFKAKKKKKTHSKLNKLFFPLRVKHLCILKCQLCHTGLIKATGFREKDVSLRANLAVLRQLE